MATLIKQFSLSLLIAAVAASNVDARTPEKPPTQITVPWDDVGFLILEHKILVVLPNGAIVEGKVLSRNPDSLDLQITRTSDKKIQPKGKTVVPRTALHTVRLIKPQKKWRIILTSVGAGAAIPLWALASYSYNESGGGPPPPLAVAMAAGGAVGYLGGWALDSHADVIITIP